MQLARWAIGGKTSMMMGVVKGWPVGTLIQDLRGLTPAECAPSIVVVTSTCTFDSILHMCNFRVSRAMVTSGRSGSSARALPTFRSTSRTRWGRRTLHHGPPDSLLSASLTHMHIKPTIVGLHLAIPPGPGGEERRGQAAGRGDLREAPQQ